MDDITRDHESRLSHLEGEMKSVATKDFVQSALDSLRQEMSNKIDEQTRTFQQALKEQNETMTSALKEQNVTMASALKEQNAAMASALKGQNAAMTSALKEQNAAIAGLNNAITAISNREHRLKGAIDALKYALPLIISVAAIVVAALIK